MADHVPMADFSFSMFLIWLGTCALCFPPAAEETWVTALGWTLAFNGSSAIFLLSNVWVGGGGSGGRAKIKTWIWIVFSVEGHCSG